MCQLHHCFQPDRTEYYIWDEEQSARDIILIPDQSQIRVHSLNLRISQVIPVDMGAKVQECQDRDQMAVDLVVRSILNTWLLSSLVLRQRRSMRDSRCLL